jgi:type I restriction enzyme S subunit
MPFPFTPLAEQQRIADTLHSVEGAIRSGERYLEKLMSVQKSILEQSLHKVESDWTESTLINVSTNRGDYGSSSAACPYDERLPRHIRITDIDENGNLSSGSAVSLWRGPASPFLLRDGDLLIARTGFTAGKSYLYRSEDGECSFASYLVRFHIDEKRALPEYVFLWAQGNEFWRWVNRTIREVGQRNISAREYAQHRLWIPPISTQRAIVGRLWSVSQTVRTERDRLTKLREIKLGLMDDLLSERMRLPVGDDDRR